MLILKVPCNNCRTFQPQLIKKQIAATIKVMESLLKNPPANAGDIKDSGSIPGSERSPGGGHGSPLQYSCLEDLLDRGAWWVTVHRVAELDTTEVT